eukprot:c24041_g2_i1 orf=47-2413(-)
MYLNMTIPCYPAREVVSNGVLQGDTPTHFALPLLIIQITIVLVLTRVLATLIKPLRQPTVLAEVIGGVLLGPTGIGRNKAFLHAIFPKDSLTILDTVSSVGLLFYMFLVGLELDLQGIRRSGKIAFMVALSGIAVPFVAGIGISSFLHHSVSRQANFASFATLMGVPISITAFPVLARIMAERKLFKTDIAKVVLPAAAINDVCAWILLAIGVALNGPSSSPAVPAYVLLCGVGFVLCMIFVVRKLLEWIARRGDEEGNVNEIYVCFTMLGVLVAGFTTDAIGIHPLFGAFAYGIMVPKEGKFALKLAEKIEDFVRVLMLPLFFASSGLKTNLASIASARMAGFLVLLVMTACVGKISSTVVAALALKMDLRTAFAFGFLMNTKGLVELIVMNIAKDIGVFDDQTFALLVLMCLILLFFTTPAVMALYKPARDPAPYVNKNLEGSKGVKDQLRVLACVHGTRGILGLLNLVEACRGAEKKPMKLFVMHLRELSGRISSVMNMSRVDGAPISSKEDHIFVAFEAYGRFTKTPVRLLSAISQLDDMHNDVCNAATEKRATIIVLPLTFSQREDGSIEYINQNFRAVNQRVQQYAPCSVGIYVDRGLWGSAEMSGTSIDHNVALLFFGGPDDREALAFALRIAEHPNVRLFVMRFLYEDKAQSDSESAIDMESDDTQSEKGMADDKKRDEDSLACLKEIREETNENPWSSIIYEELGYRENPVVVAQSAVEAKDFSLVLVGRGSRILRPFKGSTERFSENTDLGMIGDALINAGGNLKVSMLVIQQHVNPV